MLAIGRVSTNVSASTLPSREVQQAAEGDGQHEDVDEQKIEREQPDRLLDVPLVDVLDHEHLELSRQDDDRHHREQGQRDPARITGARVDGEQLGQIAGGRRRARTGRRTLDRRRR